MAKVEFSRLIIKRFTQTGITPTVPSSEDIEDFIDTDLFLGELAINLADDKIWYRATSGIVEITGGGGGGGDSIMSADDTMTANRTQDLASFLQQWNDGRFKLNNSSLEYNVVALGNTSTALDVDLNTGRVFSCTANDNFTLTFSNENVGYFDIICTQDGTGSRVLTGGAEVKWSRGVVKLLSTTGGSVDIINGFCDGTNVYLSIENDWS